MEPAERQEKIPTESQKERTREREEREREIARGMKAYCGLERNYCNGGEGRKRESEDTAAQGGGEKERVATILPRPRREGDL